MKTQKVVICFTLFLGILQLSVCVAAPKSGFQIFPNAHLLCEQSVLAAPNNKGKRLEILWRSYGTTHQPSEVVRFYSQAYQVTAKPNQQTITIKADRGERILDVYPTSSTEYPRCGVMPKTDDRTVIVVSHIVRR